MNCQHFLTARDTVRRKYKYELDRPYGRNEGQKYDVYGTDLPENAPSFIFIHGGYWQMLSRSESTFCVPPLVEAGCRVYILGYSLCPQVSLPDLLNEIEEGVSAILQLAHRSGSPSVSIAGHSAGAHCALTLFHSERFPRLPHSHLIRAVYCLAGIYDITEARHTTEANKDNILGVVDDNHARQLSPLLWDFNAAIQRFGCNVKFYIGVSQFDCPEFVRQGRQMANKINGAQLLEVPDIDHMDIVTELADPDFAITKCILKNLRNFPGKL